MNNKQIDIARYVIATILSVKLTGDLDEMFDDFCSPSDVVLTANFSNDPKHFVIWQLQYNQQAAVVSIMLQSLQ